MYQTIQVSSCVSAQGEFVESLSDGRVVIQAGSTRYRGLPIPMARPLAAAGGISFLSEANSTAP